MKKRVVLVSFVVLSLILIGFLVAPNTSSASNSSKTRLQNGLGDCPSETQYEYKDEQAPFTFTSPGTIDMVIIKAGSQNQGEACFALTEDNPSDGCYTAIGLGLQTVTVTGGGTGPDCKEISHVQFYVTHDEPIFTEEPPTEEPTEEPTEPPTEEPTEPPTEEPTEEVTPVVTEEPTDEPTETPPPVVTLPPVETPEPQYQPAPQYCVTSIDLSGLSVLYPLGAQIKQRTASEPYGGWWEISVLPVNYMGEILLSNGLLLYQDGEECLPVQVNPPPFDPGIRVNTFDRPSFMRSVEIGSIEIPSIGLNEYLYDLQPLNGWVSPSLGTAGSYNGDFMVHVTDDVRLADLAEGTEVIVTINGVTTYYQLTEREVASFAETAQTLTATDSRFVTCTRNGQQNVSYLMIPR